MIGLNNMSSCNFFGGFLGKALGLLRDAYVGNNGVIIYNGIQFRGFFRECLRWRALLGLEPVLVCL